MFEVLAGTPDLTSSIFMGQLKREVPCHLQCHPLGCIIDVHCLLRTPLLQHLYQLTGSFQHMPKTLPAPDLMLSLDKSFALGL